jgi:hypothetical protein
MIVEIECQDHGPTAKLPGRRGRMACQAARNTNLLSAVLITPIRASQPPLSFIDDRPSLQRQ